MLQLDISESFSCLNASYISHSEWMYAVYTSWNMIFEVRICRDVEMQFSNMEMEERR